MLKSDRPPLRIRCDRERPTDLELFVSNAEAGAIASDRPPLRIRCDRERPTDLEVFVSNAETGAIATGRHCGSGAIASDRPILRDHTALGVGRENFPFLICDR